MLKLGVINGLRGFAILAVIYHHVFSRFTGPGYGSFELANITFLPFTYFANGWLGVNLFFILSGFVLSYPYFLQKRDFVSFEDIKGYYLRRAKRLLPLYYFSIIICAIFIAQPVSITSFAREFFLLATVLFNFTNDMFFPRYNWVLWAIGIIILFSALFPFLLISVKKIGIMRVLSMALLISLIVRIIGNSPAYYIGNPVLNPVKDSLFGHLDEFVWGMFLCHYYVNNFNKAKDHEKIQGIGFFFIGIASITISCFLWDYVRLNLVTRSVIPFINIVLDMGFVLLIMSLLRMKKNLSQWIFNNYILQLIGVMSYSLYVWHGVAISKVITQFDAAHIMLYFTLVFILSCLSYRYIEFGHIKDTKSLLPAVRK